MSWSKDATRSQVIQVDDTPKKDGYVQVPTSSPIYVKSSPVRAKNDMMPPSRTQLEAATAATAAATDQIDEEKEKKLEAKRQAIRNHKDFPMVKRKFYYLHESDIFKGFVKGKGNLREITQWLTENYNKAEILGRHEAEVRRQRELAREEKLRQEKERLLRAYELQEEQNRLNEKEAKESNVAESAAVGGADETHDEDNSPIKMRGKARTKTIQSPTKDEEANHYSTKVQLQRPKVSILDKYKYKPKLQVRIDEVFGVANEPVLKKRKLVRASGMTDSSSELDDSIVSDKKAFISNFAYEDAPIPKLKKTLDNHFVRHTSNGQSLDVVPDDDLDRLEEKIRANRRAAKNSKRSNIADSDDGLEDEDLSDGLSEEDEEALYNYGLTSIDSQILEFLNNASVQDITEISNVPPKVAEMITDKRPYESVYVVAADNFEVPDPSEDKAALEKRRRNQKKTMGQKIIENTEFSLKGYKAVDSLIKKCSEYGDLISNQMKQWGVNVTGEGELELVDLEPVKESIDLTKDPATNDDDDEDDDIIFVKSRNKGLKYMKEKPRSLSDDIDLKNYQQVGINWLNLLYCNNLSCILADEMGLGKTCQVISFMALLKETKPEKGPHLVVVPSSTLENWLREFQKFCPSLIVQAYYGSQREREDLRYDLQSESYDVLVTTYNLATGAAPDFKFLRNQDFNMIIYDEGHMLKNSTSERYSKLMRLKADFRLLLTGTPLQNNLKELVSLLSFMLPDLFNDKREDLQGLFNQKVSTADTSDKGYNPLLSLQAIAKAKTMMTPFVLRRKKQQVLKHLPKKTHKVTECELTEAQHKIYSDYLSQGKKARQERERRKKLTGKEYEQARKNQVTSSSNVMMSLRKAALHPLLFRVLYTDKMLEKMSRAIMKEPEYFNANQTYILEDMKIMVDYELNNLCEKFPKTLGDYILKEKEWFNSGKISKLIDVVNQTIERGEKILIFSLFTQMLDVLEKVLTFTNIKFLRLDGQTSVDTRQDLIDQFYEDHTIPVFLLSTKAGGFGINLVAANNVIVFDQSFNPHDDKQAEDRAHRVGQTKEVAVTKLISNGTIEQNMLQLAENKLQLDHSISTNDMNDSKFEEKALSLFEKILFD